MTERTRACIDFDPHSRAYAQDPVGTLRRIRENCPVAFSEAYGGFWLVTRHEDVRRIAHDTDTFSSRHDIPNDGKSFTGAFIPAQEARFGPVEMDPPQLTQFRRLLNPLFSKRAAETYRPRITEFVTGFLDERIESGEIDFVRDLTNPLPATVTLELLGLPVADWPSYAIPYHNMVACPPGSAEYSAALEGVQRCMGEVVAAVADRRANPRDDLITLLTTAELDGRPIENELVIETISLLLAAGLDTTTGALTNALSHLGEHPELRAELLADTARIPPFIEEVLRYYSPTQGLARTATREVEMRGQRIGAGDRILNSWAGANRDGAEFPDPDSFIPDRSPNRHLAFGGGAHTCLGAPLARLQMAIAVEQVLRRMPDYRVGQDIERYQTIGTVNGWHRMPATFTPGPRLSTAPAIGIRHSQP
jgi:cytochrome P450